MHPDASRFAAALLAQNPGSELVERSPSALVVSVPMGGVRAAVVVLEAAGHGVPLSQGIATLVEKAQLGMPLHLVVVNTAGLDVETPLKEHIKPTGLQMKQVGGWSWVPGQPVVSVRGPAAPAVKVAGEYANAHPELSLETVAETQGREAARAQQFLAQVMTRKPVVSWTIAAVCVVFFGLQYLWGQGQPVLAAARMGAEIPRLVLAGEWWRLFSVMLLHANVFHLAMNMLALLSFGPFLERLIGSSRYLVLYVLSGLGGSLLSLTRGGEGIGVGASGGVWGLMVAGAVVVTWPRGLLPASLAHQLRQRAWTPVGINLIYSLQPGIDMLAHLGGGLAGAGLVYLLTRGAAAEQPLRRSLPADLAAVLVGLVLAGSMGLALAQGRPWSFTEAWTLEPVTLEGGRLQARVPAGWPREARPAEGSWRFGELVAHGAELEVTVSAPVEEPIDDVGLVLDELVTELKAPAPGMRFGQPPQRRTLPSGRQVVFAEQLPEQRGNPYFVWQWWWLQPDQSWVRVTASALSSASDERRQQLVEMVESLQPAPSP